MKQPLRCRKSVTALAIISLTVWTRASAAAEPLPTRENLQAVLPPALMGYAGVETPADENIRIETDDRGRFLEFHLLPGQARKNNGIRSEISINYPFREGDVVKYEWEMRLPENFKPDPENRWWIMGQWHDQPDRTKGETWDGFPGRSPPVSLNYRHTEGKDWLALMTGSPRMTNRGLIPIARGKWHRIAVVIQWSQGADGRAAVYLDGSKEPAASGTGPNMHNGYQHYLKLGMYRHPQIATRNSLGIRNVQISIQPTTIPGKNVD